MSRSVQHMPFFALKEHLRGRVIVAFADTLFYTDFKIPEKADGVIWVKKVENWQQFGVVKVGKEGFITEFVEKSPTYVSDQAIIVFIISRMEKT